MAKERKRKEKTTPFRVNLMRSQVLYRAAQTLMANRIADFCLLGVHVTAMCLLWHGSKHIDLMIACLAERAHLPL